MTSDQFWRGIICAAFLASVPAIKSAIRAINERSSKRR
jgi:hypothetical protein